MAERPEIAPVIERLERASEGSRELDAEIAALCHPTDDPRHAAFESGRDYPDTYTTSLDAALTLVPEGWWAEIYARADQPSCRLYEFPMPCRKVPDPPYVIAARSVPLALCIAALKARAEIAPR